jgi:acyl-CoA thioesterase I
MIAKAVFATVATAALLGCSRPASGPRTSERTPPPSPPAVESAPADAGTILFVGTSLTAGLGVDPDQAYPALIQKKLDAEGLHYHVVNAGVSGETSAGARRRIDWLLQKPVAVLVVETGANDGLRGQDTSELKANIQAILDRARRESPPPRLILVGMQTVTNYGLEYGNRFRNVYVELASANHVAFVPFLLEGVGGVSALNQADGVHPTAEGHRLMAENVWRVLRPLLTEDPMRAATK